MKVFSECDRRRDGHCIQSEKPCVPGLEIGIEFPDKCWRMCLENKQFLQCPKCGKRLWFDNYVANRLGSGDVFYCPRCEKNVDRGSAMQTVQCIARELMAQEAIVSSFEKMSFAQSISLGPHDCSRRNDAACEVVRLQALIIEIAKKTV